MQRRILLADDHEIVRRGLRSILGTRPDWEICGEAADGREAVDEAKRLLPDLVIMDIGMPVLNGLGATRQIIRELPGTEVLILTMHQSEQIVWEVLDAGARGFVLKSDAGSDLVAAAEALLEHKLSLTGKISELLLRAYLSQTPRPEESELTVREQETLELLAEGKSNKGIAEALHISVKTAEAHRSRLMKKLNLRSMGELMRYAVRKGIIVP
jgi:DNA-binding NarL/FixJ family response regulator